MGRGTRTILSSGFLAIAVLPAYAQESEGGESEGLEEIVVTAQKRDEGAQDVPIQITTFTTQEIRDAGITSTQDFVDQVPNLELDDSDTYRNTFIVSRGIAQQQNTDSPVSIIVDGVVQNDQKQQKMNMYDVERIEVLKGPQGALYGRNAVGGAINIATRQPGNEFGGDARVLYGNGSAVDVSAGLSVPVVPEKFLLRVAGMYKEDDGRVENIFLDENIDFIDHDWSVRLHSKFIPSERVQLDLRGEYNKFAGGGQGNSPLVLPDANRYLSPQSNILGLTWGDVKDFSLKLDAETGIGTFTSITGYTDLTEKYRGDLDFRNPVDYPGGFFGTGLQLGQGQERFVELLSQELRIVSPDVGPLRWIAGVHYVHTDRNLRTRGFVDLDGSFEQIDNPALVLISRHGDDNNDAYAGFAQVDYEVSEQWEASLALRYDRDRREQRDVLTDVTRKKTFSELQPKVTLSYIPSEDARIYATYSTGFRSGGFNAPGIPQEVFQDETVDNYEVGFKSEWLDSRLRLNGAAFYMKADNLQILLIDALSASQILTNIDRATIYGADLDLTAMPVPALRFAVGLGLLDSEIDELNAFPAFEGNKTPKTAKVSLNASAQYRRALSSRMEWMTRLDYEHRGKRYWEMDNLNVRDPLDLLGLRLGVESEKLGVYLWGKNLTDENYYADFNGRAFSGLDIDLGYPAQPRTYGIEIQMGF